VSSDVPDSVAELIDLVIRNHEADWLGRQLERQGYLSYDTWLAIQDESPESQCSQLKDAMFRLYAQVSPFEATMEIAHSEGMAAIVNQLLEKAGGLERVEPREDLKVLVEQALHRLDIPLYQKPSRPPPSLENLAHYIATAVSTEATRDLLREEILRGQFGVSGEHIDLTVGILRYLSHESNLRRAVRFLVADRRTMAALANELAISRGKVKSSDDVYCNPNASVEIATERVLDALDVPRIEWQPEYNEWGARRDSYLDKIGREFDELQEFNDQEKLMRLGSVAWPYLQKLLQVSINFYAEFFGYGDENPVTQAFKYARCQNTLNRILDAIQGIEKSFAPQGDETQDAYHERELCRWHFDRDSPFQGFLNGKMTITLDEMPSDWIQSAIKFDRKLACLKPGDTTVILRLNKYKADIEYCRNFYSHKTESIVKSVGPSKARYSFQTARDLIKRLDTQLHLCPVLILTIEDGFDAYGRRVIRFVHEDDIKDDGTFQRKQVRYFFARRDEEITMHAFYFCSYPARRGKFEPVVYPVQKLLPA